ncbi:MAG: MTH938/NDUFAF3 family protein [Fusobacteriota bacterium]
MIESYSFGEIKINGVKYTSDVIIAGKKVISEWWRDRGHHMQISDMSDVNIDKYDTVIIGQGYNGKMKVDDKVKSFIKDKNKTLFCKNSTEAVKLYNELFKKEKVVLFIHLTC